MSFEELKNIYETSKSKTELAKRLNIPLNQNGIYITNHIFESLKCLNIIMDDLSGENIKRRWEEKQKLEYENNPSYCCWCGKKLSYERRNSKCCNQSCANSYSNSKRKHSEETKKKIGESYRKGLSENRYNLANQYGPYKSKFLKIGNDEKNIHKKGYKKISELIEENIIINHDNFKYNDKYVYLKSLHLQSCKVCGCKYYGRIAKNGKISYGKTCSDECHHKLVSLIAKECRAKEIANGTFQGWKSRNIISYPEKFWITVLDNNNIKYEREYKVSHPGSNQYYFLDFYIEIDNRKIDLEIDGKQHKYEDRKEHDKIRDKYLISEGFEVYRIPWNEINTENGSNKMKEKINKFLEFIK